MEKVFGTTLMAKNGMKDKRTMVSGMELALSIELMKAKCMMVNIRII